MQAIIRGEGISKVIGQEQILRKINLEIAEGEFVAIIGPSGSGKSSLLYILGLLDEPTEGTVYFQGEKIDFSDKVALSRYRNEKIGFVFQFHYLIPELNVLENVMIPMLKAGRSMKTARERAKELLTILGLSGKENREVFQLSGGEMQRVAIARALSNHPKILFCDEPTGNLDSQNSAMVMEIFSQVNQLGTTIVLVTHDLALTKYVHRVLEMLDGRIVKEHAPKHEKLFSDYLTTYPCNQPFAV